jgi:beta-glucosidase
LIYPKKGETMVKVRLNHIILFIVMLMILSSCQVSDSAGLERGKIIIKKRSDIELAIQHMTIEEKVGQLIQAERSGISLADITRYNIGSILSGGGSVPANNTPDGWVTMINQMQEAARKSSSGIPIVYGIDAVHGNSNLKNAVIFPHNIGLGAANDPELMRAIGRETAKEILAIGVDWNFAPAVSSAQDLRWGRTYESYSENIERVALLAKPYIEGLLAEGVLTTTKHFIGDGHTTFGTGEGDNFIDRGDVTMSKKKMLEGNLAAYVAAIEANTSAIMASYNSVQGVKVHGDSTLLIDLLRKQLGFEGLVVSDWEAIHTIAPYLTEQVALAINSGIDLLMQPYNWRNVYNAILYNVNTGKITQDRLDEAVRRNLVMKFEAGLFKEDVYKHAGNIGTQETKAVAREAVAKSLVLLKNNDILPLNKNVKIYLIGPASDNVGIQCGGWTLSWQGKMDPDLNNGTSLKDALRDVLSRHGGELVNNPNDADVIILVIGEKPYAEMHGDTADLSLDGPLSLIGNVEAINLAQTLGKPIVTLMIAGRPLLIDAYIDSWDAFVMAWLPGTEGLGMTDVLFGDRTFQGTLPVTWPRTNEQANHTLTMDKYSQIQHQFKYGYGIIR